jgi:putative ABC transport system permease protein
MLVNSPGFTLAAVATVALGIGANTAVFTVTQALLLRPFPYEQPQQLVTLNAKDSSKEFGGTLLRYELLRDRSQSFQGVAAWANDTLNLTGHGEPLQVPVARVSANFFALLGVQPQLGRSFSVEEGRPEGKPVVLVSDSLWRNRFGGDRNIVGQTVTLDTTPQTIIGVLPGDVQFPFIGQAEVWTSRYFEYSLMSTQRLRMGVGYMGMMARLKSGTTLPRASAELALLDRQYRTENPTAPDASPGVETTVTPLQDSVVAGWRGKILMLSAAVALVLLIGCANVASLLLSRALARRREIAVRTALGASPGALVRQLLTESVLLALFAGTLGILLSWAATRALATWGASQLPQGIPVAIDVRVLVFAVAVSLTTGILFGVFPALQASRVDFNLALRDEGRGASAGHTRTQMRNLLVVGQVALSLLLLIGAGLLLRSFRRLLRVDPGLDPRNVLTMNVSLPTVKYAMPEQQITFFDDVLRKVSALPGVRDVAISAALPLSWKRITPMLPEGQPEVPLSQRPFIDIEAVSPRWFQTLRVPVRGGREFTDADKASTPKVLIVNETFARRFWPKDNAVGKHVTVGRWTEPAEVVGVAQDIRNKGLAQEPQAQVYIPFPQLPWGNMNLLVRTEVALESMTAAVRGQISSVDADQPVTGVQTVEALMDASRAQPRFTMLLLGVFAATALTLAVTGIYGVLAYTVEQRRQEMAIRLALGAHRRDILHMVVWQGLGLTGIGIAAGLVAALGLTKLMASLLYGVGARDLATFAFTPALFLVVALLASYLPARRTADVQPMEALKGN